MKIPRPKEIQIGGRRYRVEVDPMLTHHEGCAGNISHSKLLITIDGQNGNQHKTLSLLHEILHGINNVYCHIEISEANIDGLGEGLHQVLSQLGVEIDWEKDG